MFSSLKNKKIAIWGLGTDTLPLCKKLAQAFPEQTLLIINDEPNKTKIPAELGSIKIELLSPAQISTAATAPEVLILSPGVSRYREEVLLAEKAGVEISSATHLWFSENLPGKKIVVTGTKGKSTTATLIARMLSAINAKVELAGNIGRALWSVELETSPDFWVIELSSAQLATSYPPADLAIVTSLYEEHLDWHGSAELYFQDKLNLLKNAKSAICAKQCQSLIENFAPNSMVTYSSLEDLDSEQVKKFEALYNEAPVPWAKAEPQRQNLFLAVQALEHFGFSRSQVLVALHGLKDFTGLPHRQEYLGKIAGRQWVNDSIATIPAAALAAVRSCAPSQVILLIGGLDRGIDYNSFATEILGEKNVHSIICMPSSGEKLYDLLKEALKAAAKDLPTQIHKSSSLEAAFKIAVKLAPLDATVLLSPAAPSYDKFKNFEERGAVFKNLVQSLKNQS